MRAFLNQILIFLGTATLTNDEFATVTSSEVVLAQSNYDDLSRILAARETVSDIQDRLAAYYQAAGINVSKADVGRSEIFMGSVL